jgi:hypothetical protein
MLSSIYPAGEFVQGKKENSMYSDLQGYQALSLAAATAIHLESRIKY